MIQAQVLKGFHDSLPGQELLKKAMISRLERVFEFFGFVPIDTPALEYAEILLGKGGGETDKQMFRFSDSGGRDVAMRFDLTVPFARFMALHHTQLSFPFKRYHVAKVWRGEKPQKGRYREFYQCDFDIVGVDSSSADVETLLVMVQSLENLGVDNFVINLNHREVFGRFLEQEDLKEHSADILRIVDKLSKVGEDEVRRLLMFLPIDKVEKILSYINAKGCFLDVLSAMESLAGGKGSDTQRLEDLWKILKTLGLENRFQLDPSITRGLDYYTGIVFETFLPNLPQMGSICSGGRYNNLASLYTHKKLPGVGASIGLDRLLAALEILGQIKPIKGKTQALILHQEEAFVGQYHQLAQSLRRHDVITEVFSDRKKLALQYKYAEEKGIFFVISLSATEQGFDLHLKDIRMGTVYDKQDLQSVVAKIKSLKHKGYRFARP